MTDSRDTRGTLAGLILGLMLLGLTTGASASGRLSPPAKPESPSTGASTALYDLPLENLYLVRSSFETPASPEAVWRVLSDYPHLAGVVQGLESSRVLQREGSKVVLEQTLRGGFLFFRRTLRLRLLVHEHKPRLIEFALAGPGPFRRYEGSWVISPESSGSRVDYTLVVSRGDLAPLLVERRLFWENSSAMALDLSREIAHRAVKSSAGFAPK